MGDLGVGSLYPKFVSNKSFNHCSRGVISTFPWGGKIFFIFQCHRSIEKLEKQHFVCSNLTLFIVPFFLSFFFSLFSLFFLFFLSFFLFFFFLGGRRPPAPLKWRPCIVQYYFLFICYFQMVVKLSQNCDLYGTKYLQFSLKYTKIISSWTPPQTQLKELRTLPRGFEPSIC